MRIKSGVWYWLAVASGAVGMLYALGFAGSIEALGVISDADFITAMVLLLLALFFVQLGDHAAEREVQRRRYIDRRFWTSKFGCSNEQFGSSSAAIRFWML